MTKVGKIHFEIGELVLDGFDYHDQFRIKRAIENELVRLVSESDMSWSPNKINKKRSSNIVIDAGDFKLTHRSNPLSIGTEVAHSIHNALVKNYRTYNK